MASVAAEARKSVCLTWEAEAWLPIGLPIVAVAYAVWIGATGLAVLVAAAATGVGLVVDPWTPATDAVVGGLAVAWLVLPAGVAAWLVRERLTTDSGSIVVGYRLHHPLLLLVPPALVVAAGLAAIDRVGAAAWVFAVLAGGGIWLVIRTVAYAYRVFALSLPPVAHAVTFLSAAGYGLAVVVLGAAALDLGDPLVAVATGLEARTGLSEFGVLVHGTVVVRGARVPMVLALATALPVGLSLSYVTIQLVAGVIARLLQPTVRRPELRAGQRYPAFARPTADVTPPPAGTAVGSSPGTSTNADTAEPPGLESEQDTDDIDDSNGVASEPSDDADVELSYDLRNTRVYRPSEDAAAVDPEPAAIADGAPQCPACGTELLDDGTCPSCGSPED